MRALCELIVGSIVAVALLGTAHAQTVELEGRPYVLDGDGLVVGGVVVRLAGVDACEVGQWATFEGQRWPCGQVATAWLALLTLGRSIQCRGDRYDADGRLLARCTLDGEDIGHRGLVEGVYVAYRYRGRVTVPAYGPVEDGARAAGTGIWASDFDMPWQWRRNGP